MSERGQATVELIGVLPALLLLAMILFQLLAVGYSAVLANHAAEAAAIASANGLSSRRAAVRAVPGWAGRALSLSKMGSHITVVLRPPSPLKFVSDKLKVEGKAVVKGKVG